MTTETRRITVDDILLRARLANGTVQSHGGELKVRIPGGIPSDLYAALKAHKDEIVAHLEVLPRLTKGFDYLWSLEQQGQTNTAHYSRWLSEWLGLLFEYEKKQDASA